ncbi:hypothetical protein DdX_05834 [Ditylenchus destructor]|uniref:Uncharacterized protein n=1 Tax=Ditylenchus destructor TaxID=166010 RepID=A0AAD4NBE0_9BILA|nr:hypothetical protein DdX_05834 [Ditylenchus destructor]
MLDDPIHMTKSANPTFCTNPKLIGVKNNLIAVNMTSGLEELIFSSEKQMSICQLRFQKKSIFTKSHTLDIINPASKEASFRLSAPGQHTLDRPPQIWQSPGPVGKTSMHPHPGGAYIPEQTQAGQYVTKIINKSVLGVHN